MLIFLQNVYITVHYYYYHHLNEKKKKNFERKTLRLRLVKLRTQLDWSLSVVKGKTAGEKESNNSLVWEKTMDISILLEKLSNLVLQEAALYSPEK